MPTEAQFRRMVSEAPDQAARSALYRARRDGDLKIDDEIPLAPIPTHCIVAQPVEITKDGFGRTKMKPVETARSEAHSTSGAPRLSADDQWSFDQMRDRFSQLPDRERRDAMDALVKAAIPRLIHD